MHQPPHELRPSHRLDRRSLLCGGGLALVLPFGLTGCGGAAALVVPYITFAFDGVVADSNGNLQVVQINLDLGSPSQQGKSSGTLSDVRMNTTTPDGGPLQTVDGTGTFS